MLFNYIFYALVISVYLLLCYFQKFISLLNILLKITTYLGVLVKLYFNDNTIFTYD
jgi:hypothetical protein